MDLEQIKRKLLQRYPRGTQHETLVALMFAHKELFQGQEHLWTNQAAQRVVEREFRFIGILNAPKAESSAPQPVPKPSERRQKNEEKHRKKVEELVSRLRERYTDYRFEASLANLKKENPDIPIGSFAYAIRCATGLTPTEFFLREKLVIPTEIRDLNLDHLSRIQLYDNGIRDLAGLMQLSEERLHSIVEDTVDQIRIRTLQRKVRLLWDVPLEELSFSDVILNSLRNAGIVTPLEIIDGGSSVYGIGQVRKEQIRQQITQYIRDYYRKYFGEAPLEDMGLSKATLGVLKRNGLDYIYEVFDGCIGAIGIGVVRASEIMKAFAAWEEAYCTADAQGETTQPAASEAEPAAENIQQQQKSQEEQQEENRKKEEAEQQLKVFSEKLQACYPEGCPKDTLMLHLRREHPELPFEEATGWCQFLYGVSVKQYLEDRGFFAKAEEEPLAAAPAKKKAAQEKRPEKLQFHPIQVAAQEQAQLEQTNVHLGVAPVQVFEEAELDDYVKQDAHGFMRFAEANCVEDPLSELYRYIRRLHRGAVSAFLKETQNISYAEKLITQGIIKEKTESYWIERLLSYLKENHQYCSAGSLDVTQASYEYDAQRDLCMISAPIYEGSARVSSFLLEERYSGKLALQPCYCEENCSCDVALVSNGQIIGQLNRSRFRSNGLGTMLFPVFATGAAVVQSVRIAQGEYPHVLLTLRVLHSKSI